MRQQHKPILTDLHARLYSILPEYQPISASNNKSGTYKAIDADGNVYLVDITCNDNTISRRKRFWCDYQTLVATSVLQSEPKRPKPDDNWGLTLLG